MRRLLLLLAALVAATLLAVAWWTTEGPNWSRIEPGLYVGGDVGSPPCGTGFVLNLHDRPDSYAVAHYAHEPINDGEPCPDLAWLRRMVGLVEEHRRAGRTVFVHCRNGVSRSGMVAVAYLMREHGMTLEEALAFARRARPGIRPNPVFLPLLRQWENSVTR